MIIVVGSRHHKRDLRLVPTIEFYLEKEIAHFHEKYLEAERSIKGFFLHMGRLLGKNPYCREFAKTAHHIG